MEEQIKPLRRSNELIPLSRDHHDGLLLCWKIRQGLENKIDIARITAYVFYCFENELKPHFQQEEEFVFNLLPDDDPVKTDVLAQHHSIRTLATAISDGQGGKEEQLKLFEKELNNHIRFEERMVFPHVEKIANTAQFAEAGKRIEELHSAGKCPAWPDDFWTKEKNR